jgi:single-strand DNA-binding protein
MINRVVLVGRLTRDPEVRTTGGGKSVCDFSIAVNKRMKPTDGSPDADFFRITAWDKTADYVGNYLNKGRLVAVDGRLQSRKYTGNDGVSREVVEVVAESVQGLDRPKDDTGGGEGGGYARSAPREAATPVAVSAADIDEYDPFADQ